MMQPNHQPIWLLHTAKTFVYLCLFVAVLWHIALGGLFIAEFLSNKLAVESHIILTTTGFLLSALSLICYFLTKDGNLVTDSDYEFFKGRYLKRKRLIKQVKYNIGHKVLMRTRLLQCALISAVVMALCLALGDYLLFPAVAFVSALGGYIIYKSITLKPEVSLFYIPTTEHFISLLSIDLDEIERMSDSDMTSDELNDYFLNRHADNQSQINAIAADKTHPDAWAARQYLSAQNQSAYNQSEENTKGGFEICNNYGTTYPTKEQQKSELEEEYREYKQRLDLFISKGGNRPPASSTEESAQDAYLFNSLKYLPKLPLLYLIPLQGLLVLSLIVNSTAVNAYAFIMSVFFLIFSGNMINLLDKKLERNSTVE